MCIRLGIGIVVSSLAVLVGARTPAAERDTVVYHDMAVIPKTVYGPFPEERAVLTDTSSLVIATLPPKYKQTVHYHDQEQFTLGFGGAVGYSIGGVHHDLGAHGVGLP